MRPTRFGCFTRASSKWSGRSDVPIVKVNLTPGRIEKLRRIARFRAFIGDKGTTVTFEDALSAIVDEAYECDSDTIAWDQFIHSEQV